MLLTPILFPAAMQYGIDPVFFGVMMVANLCIGMMTPPVAVTLYISQRICDVPLSRVIKEVIPLLIVLLIALSILILTPNFTLYLPRLILKY